MQNIEIKKAQKSCSKIKLAIMGVAGSGKTYSSLLLAQGLGEKTLMIDTENGSGNLYSDLCDYDIITLQPPYSPEAYIEAIKAGRGEYDTIIIDSLSHAWSGEGGVLDIQGKISATGRGNSYTAWRFVTPRHNALIETILKSSSHVIVTLRSKTDYILEANDKGKQAPRKVGLAPVQREGVEYEFTTIFDVDMTHHALVTKDRTGLFNDDLFKISPETGNKIKNWLTFDKKIDKIDVYKKEHEKQAPKFDPLDCKTETL